MANNSVKIRIDGDTSGFEKALSGIEKGLKKTISAVVKGTAVVGTAFAGATVAALNFSGELEQNLGGSEAVFKEYAKEIQDTADKAFKNMGLSASDFLATANKMGALFQGAGFSIEESANISAEAMQRAADVASIMGIDVSVAMESIAGAAKGNFTMMDNLGVAMNDTTLNAYALEIGLGKTTAQMTNQEKVALAMEMFLDRTAYAAGNYAKENNTLAGSLQTAKAALENFMAGTGSVDEVVESLTNAADVIIRNLGDLVPKLVKGVGELVENLMGQLVEMIADNAPQMIEAAVDVIAAFIEGIGKNADKIAAAAATIIQTLANAIIRLIPQIIEVAGEVMKAFAGEIANAFPLFTPLAKIIEFLADDIQTLVIAATAAVVAFKAFSIVKQVTVWFNKSKDAAIIYAAALRAQAAGATLTQMATTALNSGLTISQTLIGLVTGKIKLQTAATIALATAKKSLAGVIGIVIGLMTALAAVIVKNDKATGVLSGRIWELSEELKNLREEYKQEIQTIDNSTTAKIAEAKVAENLKNKLYELADQINSGALTEEEATKTRAEFNTVANELNDIIPGIIDNISTETDEIILQKKAIEDLITAYVGLAKAEALKDAYSSKMTEAATNLLTSQDARDTKYKEYYDVVKNDPTAKAVGYQPQATYRIPLEDEKPTDTVTGEKIDTEAKITLSREIQILDKDIEYWQGELDKWTEGYLEQSQLVADMIGNSAKDTGGDISGTAHTTAKDVNAATDSTTDAVKKAAEEQSVTIEQMLKNELRNIERAHKLGIISDKEYYDSLTQIRDKYFEEGSEDWQSYAEEIEDYYDNVIKELKEKMNSFAKKLQNETNKTYATITLDADGEVKTWYTPADMDSQNAQLEKYLSMLRQLKNLRGAVPEEAFEDLRNMDTEEAIRFLNVLLNMSDVEWNNWASGIEENKNLTEELSKEMYGDEISANEELIQKLKDEWGEVPADFFKIGEDCAAQYGEGFKTEIEGYISTWQNMLYNAFSTVPSAALNYNVVPGGAAGSTTYTDNRTTNIYANGTSPRAIIEAQNQSEIYQAHTSTFGG